MFGVESNWITFSGLLLTWVIFILGVAQLSRFYMLFFKFRKDVDAHLVLLNSNLRKLQGSLAELTIEQRRISRLTLENVELKKAELTGDFEIVDEPINAPVVTEELPKPKKFEI